MDNETSEALRITTWNMLNPQFESEKFYPVSVHKFLHWRAGRKERALAYLKPLHSHIYCIQETNEEIAKQLTSSLGNEYELIYHNRSAKGSDGCATIYDKTKLTLKNSRVQWYGTSRTHIFVTCQFLINHTATPFFVVNTHVSWATRHRELQQLRLALTKETEPLLVMGDFNAEPTESWHKDFIAHGFVDCFLETNKKHAKATFNSGPKMQKHIDFILARNVNRTSIISCFLGNNHQQPHPLEPEHESWPLLEIPSDHVPMTLDISL